MPVESMIIAATSDVHTPRFFDDFVRAVDAIEVKPDLFLMAGDMISRADVASYERVFNALSGKITCPMIACFGNTEFPDLRGQIKEKYHDVKFLDDESTVLQVGSSVVGIVGTTGGLDEPMVWEKENIPNIEEIYRIRAATLESLLGEMKASITILLTHYVPTYRTLEGENPIFYKTLGSKMYETILLSRKPTLVIHGHSHRGLKSARIDTVPIFNVSFPLNRQIVVIDTEKDLRFRI